MNRARLRAGRCSMRAWMRMRSTTSTRTPPARRCAHLPQSRPSHTCSIQETSVAAQVLKALQLPLSSPLTPGKPVTS